MTEYRIWLQNEYTNRCKRNSRYSIRAFASFLEIDSSSLSQILSGKRKISQKTLDRFTEKLGKPEIEIEFSQMPKTSEYQMIALDAFTVMSDWYHTVILELIGIPGIDHKPSSIALQLGINQAEVKIALDRLERLELITKKGKTYHRSSGFHTNYSEDITSSAHKKFQSQLIEKALEAIYNCKAEDKDITSITMAIDKNNLPLARKKIKAFRREMAELLENGKQTQVYNLGIQLFPLSKERKKK